MMSKSAKKVLKMVTATHPAKKKYGRIKCPFCGSYRVTTTSIIETVRCVECQMYIPLEIVPVLDSYKAKNPEVVR